MWDLVYSSTQVFYSITLESEMKSVSGWLLKMTYH